MSINIEKLGGSSSLEVKQNFIDKKTIFQFLNIFIKVFKNGKIIFKKSPVKVIRTKIYGKFRKAKTR